MSRDTLSIWDSETCHMSISRFSFHVFGHALAAVTSGPHGPLCGTLRAAGSLVCFSWETNEYLDVPGS